MKMFVIFLQFCWIAASRIFNILFNIVKPFLSPRTLSKVEIFPAQRNQWISSLKQDCNDDQLPLYFGGSRRTSLIAYQDFHMSMNALMISNKNDDISNGNDGLKTININPGEKVLLTFDVVEPKTLIKYVISTTQSGLKYYK